MTDSYGGNKRHRNNYNQRGDGHYRDNYRGRRDDNYRDHNRNGGDDDVLELKRRVITLGDSVNVSDTHAVRDVLSRCGDWLGEQLMFQAQEIAALVVTCAGRLSAKSEWYALLTTLLNEKNGVFGKKVVELTCQAIQTDLNWWQSEDDPAEGTTELLRIKLLIRFLGHLSTTKMIVAADMLTLLSNLQTLCTAEPIKENDRATQDATAIKDYIAYIVLDTLLHCGHALSVVAEEQFDALIAQCRAYAIFREEDGPHSRYVPNNSWVVQRVRLNMLVDPEDPDDDVVRVAKSLDPLAAAWAAVETLVAGLSRDVAKTDVGMYNPSQSSWKVHALMYPQQFFMTVIKNTVPFGLPATAFPFTLDLASIHVKKLPSYSVVYRILDDESGPVGSAIAKMHLPSYLVARSYFEDILKAFAPSVAETSKQLLTCAHWLNARLDVQAEFILVETLLVHILQHRDVPFGGAVLYQMLKQEAKTVQSALAILMELLFRQIPAMQMGTLDVFVRFFSLFLSNFEYKWPWAHWNYVLDAQADDAQRLFVSAVLERCVRLSYRQHMQSVLPEAFHMLLPPNPLHIIRFRQDEAGAFEADMNATLKDVYEDVLAKIKARDDAAEIQAWVDGHADLGKPLVLEMVVSALLEAGAATFTHFRSLLEKYQELLAMLIATTTDALAAINAVGAVWEQSPQHVILILSLMMRHNVLSSTAISTWMFSSEAVQQYSWHYVWEILDNSIVYGVERVAANTDDATAVADLHAMLRAVFEGFMKVVADHKLQCDKEGTSFKDNWYTSTLARMKAVGRRFRVALEPLLPALAADVFAAPTAEQDVCTVFHSIQASYQAK
ncbi:nuclear cap-binding protein subunit [Achlya hypogyna]|uniref:Nuclear cap-binding protein subunit n=1 Tax=Achlya hypogyna TaxID=1202772 RepID=A0A1V9ZMJ3_ACHHY|nr:nuclear cap-binding protein subunit [Achlya hypogyna]